MLLADRYLTAWITLIYWVYIELNNYSEILFSSAGLMRRSAGRENCGERCRADQPAISGGIFAAVAKIALGMSERVVELL